MCMSKFHKLSNKFMFFVNKKRSNKKSVKHDLKKNKDSQNIKPFCYNTKGMTYGVISDIGGIGESVGSVEPMCDVLPVALHRHQRGGVPPRQVVISVM